MKLSRKHDLILRLNKIKLVGIKWCKCGDVVNESITNIKVSGILPLRFILSEWMDTFHINTYHIEKTGDGNVVFYYLSDKAIPHIVNKISTVANLVNNRIEVKVDETKGLNKYWYLSFLIPIWSIQLWNTGMSLYERLHIAILLSKTISEVKEIRKVTKLCEDSIKLAVSIHDKRMLDNMLIQTWKRDNRKTVTMCHGIFRLPWDEFDYICSPSDYFMVVNERMYHEALSLGMKESALVRVGPIQYIDKERELFIPIGKFQGAVFGVFLNHPNNTKGNIALLRIAEKIAEEYQMKYYVKVHPTDSNNKYDRLVNNQYFLGNWKKKDSIIDCSEKLNFALVGADSIMFQELAFYGKLAFRFKTDDMIDICDEIEELRFSSYEELKRVLCACNSIELQEIIYDHICDCYFSQNIRESYESFFEQLTKGEI